MALDLPVSVPVGLIGCFATLRVMPDIRANCVHRFDGRAAGVRNGVDLAGDRGVSGRVAPVGVLVLLVFGFASITAYWLRGASALPALRAGPVRHTDPQHRIAGNLFRASVGHAVPDPLAAPGLDGLLAVEGGLMMLPIAAAWQ
jgi:hypothetical protein